MATLNWRTKKGKANGAWYLNWREGGKRHQVSLGKVSKKEAEIALRRKEYELDNADVTASRVTVEAFVDGRFLKYYEPSVTKATFERAQGILKNQILPMFGTDILGQLDIEKVEMWKQTRMKDNAAPETINKELNLLRNLVHRAQEWELINKDPIKYVKDVKNTRSKPFNFYTVEQLNSIYEAADAYQYAWQLMANTGMRRGEAGQLKWSDISSDQIHIVSTEEERTKSGHWRAVPISPGARAALDQLGQSNRKGYVLDRVAPRSLTRAFAKDRERAGLINGTLHDLRHTFCSHLVMNGAPLRSVQLLAGHSSIKVTEQYAHLEPKFQQSVVDGLTL